MNLYVGNLSFSISEDELRGVFEKIGPVDSVKIITDRETGRSKGFGFVEMGSIEDGNSAIEKLNGTDIAGRNVIVNEARPREKRSFNNRY